MTTTPEDIDVIGSEDMNLDGGVLVTPSDGGTALVVPFRAEQLAQLEATARERRITPVEVVQRLVEERFAARGRS